MAECPITPDEQEPEAPEESCANCKFHAYNAEASICRRYPEPRDVPVSHWCGEYQLIDRIRKDLMHRRLTLLESLREKREKEKRTMPYGGHKPSDHDIAIDGCRLFCTCSACPEQYDVFDEATQKQIGYLRLRGGFFRADVPDCGGVTVYSAHTNGDGVFDDDEKMPQLKKAVKAIKKYLKKNG